MLEEVRTYQKQLVQVQPVISRILQKYKDDCPRSDILYW